MTPEEVSLANAREQLQRCTCFSASKRVVAELQRTGEIPATAKITTAAFSEHYRVVELVEPVRVKPKPKTPTTRITPPSHASPSPQKKEPVMPSQKVFTRAEIVAGIQNGQARAMKAGLDDGEKKKIEDAIAVLQKLLDDRDDKDTETNGPPEDEDSDDAEAKRIAHAMGMRTTTAEYRGVGANRTLTLVDRGVRPLK